MKARGYLVIVYGLLLFIGGLIGHLKANSKMSLIMGSISAILAIGLGYGMLKNWAYGKMGALALATALFFFFLYRFSLTMRFMPPGLMAIISLIVIAALLIDNRKR